VCELYRSLWVQHPQLTSDPESMGGFAALRSEPVFG